MKKISLFEHNEIAYKRLKRTLETSKVATINHATGTGKSFIALKHLYENRNKKYLYIAPTYEILDQLMEDTHKIGISPEELNVDTMIYRNLLGMDMEELYQKYDGIIFDEYHRSGAKETYKQIKKLKLILDKNKDEKRFIGLTATPIRFLDKARNMTKELFDGIVASRLSLSEAMLDGLLPIPLYINSKIACREDYQKTLRKVNRLAPGKEKEKLLKDLEKIGNQINNGVKDNATLLKKYIKERDGKYIVFCNNIANLEKYYDEIDSWFEGIGEVKKYKVHSGQKREQNKDELSKFNSEKKGISVLLCVDILNEGVHVDDIDGVILLRKTKSPIIYFQQIGRVLSFSGRNKQIKIFDLVNNFKNHDAIYAIYRELKEELKRKIELNPAKKEEYEKKLEKFVILDETKEIIDGISSISKKVTREKIIESKIDYSIELLSKYVKQNPNKGKTLSLDTNEDTKKAYLTISKYYKYVNNTQLNNLISLDILLPEELIIPLEERKELLGGYNSIHEKEKDESNVLVRNYVEFINTNSRRPEINSKNTEEIYLAQRYLNSLLNLDDELKSVLKSTFINKKIKFDSWEKLLLGEEITSDDLENLIQVSTSYIENENILPDYLYEALNEFQLKYTNSKNEDIFKIIKASEMLEDKKREKEEEERQQRICEILDELEKNSESLESNVLSEALLEKIQFLKRSDRNYIKKKYFSIKKKYYSTLIHNEERSNISEFCKKMRLIKSQKDSEIFYTLLEEDKKMCTRIYEIIDFVEKNHGKFPNTDNGNEEAQMAKDLEKYLKRGNIKSQFLEIGMDFNSLLHSSTEVVKDIIEDNLKEIMVKKLIVQNIEFYQKNGRRPLKNSSNNDEKELAVNYEKICIPYLGKGNIAILNKTFNSYTGLTRTCDQFIKNIKLKEKEDLEESK